MLLAFAKQISLPDRQVLTSTTSDFLKKVSELSVHCFYVCFLGQDRGGGSISCPGVLEVAVVMYCLSLR